jgi:ABC-type microcin C transport system permease subunit YejB
MDWKKYGLRFLGLMVLVVAGFYAFALTTNILILIHAFPQELVDKAFGVELAQKTMFVLVGSTLLGLVAVFLKEQWRLILYFSPLYAPSLFAVIYTLMQGSAA